MLANIKFTEQESHLFVSCLPRTIVLFVET